MKIFTFKRSMASLLGKANLFIAAIVFSASGSYAQGVSISTTGGNPDPSALLDVNSTGAPFQGTLLPRITTLQRDAIVAPAQSLLIYNTTTKCYEFFENGFWQTMSCAQCPLPLQPGVISGANPLCQNTSGAAFSVANVSGVTYAWTYSGTGFTCTSGCTTNSVTADFSGSATSGILTCTPSNFCGAGTPRTLSITINTPPTVANAGPDQLNLSGTSAILAGNTAVSGAGTWSVISGSGGSVSSPSNPASTFTGTPATSYVLRWTISNSPCTATFDEVTISFAAAPVCTVGAAMGGGKAFLLSGGKCYISALTDGAGTPVWGCASLVGSGAQGTAIGTGQTNTAAAAGCALAGSAIKVCDDLVSGGFSDWYLPSLNEMNVLGPLMSNSTVPPGVGGFYRTSSEVDLNNAYSYWFFNGVAYSQLKSAAHNFRCIRSF